MLTESARHRDGIVAGTPLPAGLVPVAFSFGRRRVRLLDARGIDCREHNFRQTVERWATDHPERGPVDLGFDTFVEAARQVGLRAPTGFVINVARCGSTLLANMLAALPSSVVIKESATVAILLHRLLAAPTEIERRQLEALLTVTLPLFGRLADSPTGGSIDVPGAGLPAPRLFVKPHSSLTVGASTLLRLFPETPAIFLYREPGEVVASMQAKPPYGGLYDVPREQLLAGFPSLASAPADLSPAALHAHLWRSPVEAALALPSDRLLFLDYADLVGHPAATIERLTDHFGIHTDPETVARMAGIMRVYAKDASGQMPFDAEGAHRRPPLDGAQLADVAGVVGDLYARLAARREQPKRADDPSATRDQCQLADNSTDTPAYEKPMNAPCAYSEQHPRSERT